MKPNEKLSNTETIAGLIRIGFVIAIFSALELLISFI